MHNQEARASGYEAVAFDTMLWAGTSDYGILACMVVLSAGCFLLSDYGTLACMVVLSAECFERLDRGVLLCPRKVGNLHGFGVLQQRSLGIGFKEKKCLGHGSEPLASLHL